MSAQGPLVLGLGLKGLGPGLDNSKKGSEWSPLLVQKGVLEPYLGLDLIDPQSIHSKK